MVFDGFEKWPADLIARAEKVTVDWSAFINAITYSCIEDKNIFPGGGSVNAVSAVGTVENKVEERYKALGGLQETELEAGRNEG